MAKKTKIKSTKKKAPAKAKGKKKIAPKKVKRTAKPAPAGTGAIVTGTDPCTCGRSPEEHGRDPKHPGWTGCTESDCIAYEADPPEATYEDEHPPLPVQVEDDYANDDDLDEE